MSCSSPLSRKISETRCKQTGFGSKPQINARKKNKTKQDKLKAPKQISQEEEEEEQRPQKEKSVPCSYFSRLGSERTKK
jgi:hypothetical protein